MITAAISKEKARKTTERVKTKQNKQTNKNLKKFFCLFVCLLRKINKNGKSSVRFRGKKRRDYNHKIRHKRDVTTDAAKSMR